MTGQDRTSVEVPHDDDPPSYVLCTNPHCAYRYAYLRAGGEDPHYHFVGSIHHPAWDVP